MMPLWLHSPSQNLAIEGIHDVHFAFYHAQHALAIIRKAKSRKRGCVVSLIADLRTGKGRSNDNSGSVILIVCCLYALSHYTCSPCPTSHVSSCALKYCAYVLKLYGIMHAVTHDCMRTGRAQTLTRHRLWVAKGQMHKAQGEPVLTVNVSNGPLS